MKTRIALAMTLLLGLLVAVTPRLLKRAFVPPRREVHQTPADLGLPEETVWLDSVRGPRLHGWFIPVDGRAPAVVVLHGWTGNAAHLLALAPPLHDAGFHSLFLDARSHGLSEDDDHMSMPRFAEDLEVAVHYLRERSDVTSVGVIGHSVGAAAVILAASRGVEIEAAVAVSAFAHPGELMKEQFTFPRPVTWALLKAIESVIGYRYGEIAPRNRIGEVPVPLLLVHGDADEVVPVSNAFELHNQAPETELLIVPGGTHSDLTDFEPFFTDVMNFLETHLVVPAPAPTTR